ncbi:hypothetical protein CHLRE_17g734821v5 [Chlamydomonas reinhardtii]|uniref:Uncharacterized protein n=1 Tax=Chlamydomonas reinhardtii TaxID=3055 RepID=A0A2K3CRB6_CHLRE|nr:uncharacterized protein CHLRE_17g734821v5 [Chlamydomonas reinhardtii]PNW70822.1 hypothetical protein CHLRE_17g734821v5 [Chlamydomonas reinhardtii]
MDSIKIGHRVEEAMTGAQHSVQQTGDQIKEATMGGQHGTESAATKAQHSVKEATQSTGHCADETAEKAKPHSPDLYSLWSAILSATAARNGYSRLSGAAGRAVWRRRRRRQQP